MNNPTLQILKILKILLEAPGITKEDVLSVVNSKIEDLQVKKGEPSD